jgi:hypothetical protein
LTVASLRVVSWWARRSSHVDTSSELTLGPANPGLSNSTGEADGRSDVITPEAGGD